MNSTTITKLYDQLSSKIGKDTAESLIQFIEQKVREESKEQAPWENPRWVWWLLVWLQVIIAAAVWLFHFLK